MSISVSIIHFHLLSFIAKIVTLCPGTLCPGALRPGTFDRDLNETSLTDHDADPSRGCPRVLNDHHVTF